MLPLPGDLARSPLRSLPRGGLAASLLLLSLHGIAACSSESASGADSGASCNLKSDKYMRECSGGCGDVMGCATFCASCDSLCQVICTRDADCEAVGAGVCKHPTSSGGDSVCTRAPSVCPGSSSSAGTGGSSSTGAGGSSSSAGSSSSSCSSVKGSSCKYAMDCCKSDGLDCFAGKCAHYCTSASECPGECCLKAGEFTSLKICASCK